MNIPQIISELKEVLSKHDVWIEGSGNVNGGGIHLCWKSPDGSVEDIYLGGELGGDSGAQEGLSNGRLV